MKQKQTRSCIPCLVLALTSFAIPILAHAESQIVTVSNTERQSLTISSISIDGKNPKNFSQTNNCGKSLGVGKSCTVDVRFTPTSPGLKEATLIVRNSRGNPLTVPVLLSGTGIENEATRDHPTKANDRH